MKKIILTITLFFFLFISHSQSIYPSVISSAGDFFSNANNSLSWTLGEPVIETFTTGGNILTQGFQQPSYTVSTFIEETVKNNLSEVKVYPVPTVHTITVDFQKPVLQPVDINVYDFYGKLILTKKLAEPVSLCQLDFSTYARGTYILKVMTIGSKNDLSVKYFKIEKN